MSDISKKEIENLKEKLGNIKESLDIENKKNILKQLEIQSNDPNLWNNRDNAQDILSQIQDISVEINRINILEKSLNDLLEMYEGCTEEERKTLQEEYDTLEKDIKEFEIYKFLSGKYDNSDAILSIHSGQGGTEANDWAEMLLRMYSMYCDNKGWKYEITHMVRGTETGISTVTMYIHGKYVYGLLKKEHGTHRLVRLSPFNAQNLRQTSFAGIEIIPVMEDIDKDINIPDEDIEFKAVRSGGPGGQNVNKTSSAVQITHIPTGITVHSSEERSQLQNRMKAMQILKGKLCRILEEERINEVSQIKGEYKQASWGNQIRNYVLHPYKLVKDLRTGIESSNPESVLDGNLDPFVEAEVRIQ